MDQEEFIEAVSRFEGGPAAKISHAELVNLFGRVDADGGGTISVEELQAFIAVGRSTAMTEAGRQKLLDDTAGMKVGWRERERRQYEEDRAVANERDGIDSALDRIRAARRAMEMSL